MKLMQICSCANTCCHLKILYFGNYKLPYNYEFILTFTANSTVFTKIVYYENLEPYGMQAQSDKTTKDQSLLQNNETRNVQAGMK